VLDRHAGVGLLEDRDDLGLGETGLLHGTSWLGKTCQKVLLMGCLRIGEAYACGGGGLSNSPPRQSSRADFGGGSPRQRLGACSDGPTESTRATARNAVAFNKESAPVESRAAALQGTLAVGSLRDAPPT